MRVCVSMLDVVKPSVTMCAPLCRSMPAGCGVRSCVSMCAPRAVRCHPKDPITFQLRISNADPSLCIQQRSPAISHTINPVFTIYSRSPRCFYHHQLDKETETKVPHAQTDRGTDTGEDRQSGTHTHTHTYTTSEVPRTLFGYSLELRRLV